MSSTTPRADEAGATALAADQVPDSPRPGLLGRLANSQPAVLFLVLAGLVVFFSIARPGAFPTVANARNIASDAAILLVLAVGSTFVILTAGIDLSINGVLIFSGVIAAKAMVAVGGDGALVGLVGLLAALIAGVAWGAVNGILVARARIPALIVTLGTWGMSLGLSLLITGGVDIAYIPKWLVNGLGSGRIQGVPWLVIVSVLVAVLGGLLLAVTRFGRYTYAVGSNPESCRRAGINVPLHLIKVYALAGFLSGLAGYLSVARFATTTLGGHSTDNMQTIAAVVIGGTSLFGGVGTMIGTAIGVFIPVVLLNGFVVLGMQPFWQQVAVGAVLIVAVYIDQLRRRMRDR
jgi:ribose transport system permease protein